MGTGRDDALALLPDWNESPSLRNHGLLVEAGVRGYATDDGLDEATVERWGVAGLLHDLDYERHPDPATHGAIGADELARRGYPGEVVDAVRRHNDALAASSSGASSSSMPATSLPASSWRSRSCGRRSSWSTSVRRTSASG